MGGHITVYPVSRYQCRAKAMLKCSSIVCLSSFVPLTNEVRYRVGNREGGGEPHNGSRCSGTANICTAASVANKQLPPEEKGQLSTHKRLRYRHINPGLTPPTYLCPPFPSLFFFPQIPSVQDNCQDASWQHVTLWRSS